MNEWKRGVVFIKEIVPKPIQSFIANIFYEEHYQSMEMEHEWGESDAGVHIKYSWGEGDFIKVKAAHESLEIVPQSVEGFITEHYWGYTKVNSTRTFEYEIKNPR